MEGPAQGCPVAHRRVGLGDGQQAGQARFGGQQVVEAGVQLMLGHPQAQVHQAPARVVEEAVVGSPGDLLAALGHRQQAVCGRGGRVGGGGQHVLPGRPQRGQVVGAQPGQLLTGAGRQHLDGAFVRQLGGGGPQQQQLIAGQVQQGLQAGGLRPGEAGGQGQAGQQQLGQGGGRLAAGATAGGRLRRQAVEQARVAGQQRRQALARGGQAAVDRGMVVGRLGGALAAGLGHRQQVAAEVAAVDTADIARQQCGTGLGVVPVQEVAAVALQRVERAQGGLQALQQVLGADPAETAGAGRAQQVQADVGGRGAVGQHLLRRGLQVVGRQVAVVGTDAALEEAPAVTGNAGQAMLLGGGQGLPGTGRRGPAGAPAQHRGTGPQGAQPERQAGVGGAAGQQAGQQAGGQHRLAPMGSQHCRQRLWGGGLGGGGGGPLQQLPAADGHAPQRAGDRVGRQQGLRQQLGQVPGATPEGPAQPGAGLAVEVFQRDVVAAGCQPGHRAQQRAGGEARRHQHQRHPR